MFIIPVIDLLDGTVVHAKRGMRETYQSINSLLTDKTDADVILDAYYKLFPFKKVYIADLNAIRSQGDNRSIISELANTHPDCEFWLDAGLNCIAEKKYDSIKNIKLVLGSENKLSIQQYKTLLDQNHDVILSLDFTDTGLIENDYLLSKPALWPKHVIVMMLHRVGSDNGVDTQRLLGVSRINDNSEMYAAGGVRNIDDLKQLKIIGIKGALLASALHNGSITKKDLHECSL